MSNPNFLKSLPDAETVRHWRLTLAVSPHRADEHGLLEIVNFILIHDRERGTNANVSFNVNGLNPVRIELCTYALRYQADHPDCEFASKYSWGDQLGMFNALCDTFGHQGRLLATFGNDDCPFGNRGFKLDGEGGIRESFEFGEGGG